MPDRIVLEVNSVSYSWNERGSVRPVLREVSLALAASKTLAVTGPSGCGKTTLLRIMTGFLHPSSGEIRYLADDGHAPRFGFMFQDLKLVPWLTVLENLTFGHGSDHADSLQFAELTELLGLKDHLADYPARLSGGLKERTSLGRALLGRPELLMLDEPLGSTDYVHRLEIEDYIFDRIRNESIAAVIVTHDLDQAMANADRVVILPPAGSSHQISALNVPKDLRAYCPSQARLAPQMASTMRDLIASYESLL